MPVRMLYLSPPATHPATVGAQVRANALLRHYIPDLGWEVEFFCPTGSRDSSAWRDPRLRPTCSPASPLPSR